MRLFVEPVGIIRVFPQDGKVAGVSGIPDTSPLSREENMGGVWRLQPPNPTRLFPLREGRSGGRQDGIEPSNVNSSSSQPWFVDSDTLKVAVCRTKTADCGMIGCGVG